MAWPTICWPWSRPSCTYYKTQFMWPAFPVLFLVPKGISSPYWFLGNPTSSVLFRHISLTHSLHQRFRRNYRKICLSINLSRSVFYKRWKEETLLFDQRTHKLVSTNATFPVSQCTLLNLVKSPSQNFNSCIILLHLHTAPTSPKMHDNFSVCSGHQVLQLWAFLAT